MKKIELKWGETPWDKMEQRELLRELQRMYSAMRSLYSVVSMAKEVERNNPYWGKTGVGGNAIEKGRQILEPLFEKHKTGESEIFRSFFRYADDLLFDQSKGFTMIGSRWHVCRECGTMLGENPYGGEKLLGRKCSDVFKGNECNGIFRLLTWEDLRTK